MSEARPNICADCGHGWGFHAYYDDECERYVFAACDHYDHGAPDAKPCERFIGLEKETIA